MNSRLKPLRPCRTCVALLSLCWLGTAHAQVSPAAPAATPASQNDVAPRIAFPEPVHDFGRVKTGAIVRHVFVVKNTGTADLEITTVSPGCGCTTSGEWTRTIAPGKEGNIPLQLNTGGMSGDVSKHISITCNDPRQANVTLEMKGVVWKAVDISPAMAVFSITEEASAPITRSVRIVSNLDQPLTLSNPRSASEAFTAELSTIREGREFELRITALPPFKGGVITGPITLQTSSADVGDVSVPAQLIVQPSVVAIPERVNVPATALRSPMTSTVSLRNNGTEPMEVASASIDIPGAEVRTEVVQPNRLFRISVTLPAGFDPSRHNGASIKVTTNHPKHGVVHVPIVATTTPRIIVRQLSESTSTPPAATATPAAPAPAAPQLQ